MNILLPILCVSFRPPRITTPSPHSAGLPHLDALDRESPDLGVARPGIPPPVLGVPEVRHGREGVVKPWLAAFAIREPAVCRADAE